MALSSLKIAEGHLEERDSGTEHFDAKVPQNLT